MTENINLLRFIEICTLKTENGIASLIIYSKNGLQTIVCI